MMKELKLTSSTLCSQLTCIGIGETLLVGFFIVRVSSFKKLSPVLKQLGLQRFMLSVACHQHQKPMQSHWQGGVQDEGMNECMNE